jgi:hypothetical protein
MVTRPSGDLTDAAAAADIVIECTGFVQLLLDAKPQNPRYRIICLTGVSPVGTESVIDPGLLTGIWSCRIRSCSARSTPTGSTTNWREPDDIKAVLTFLDAPP